MNEYRHQPSYWRVALPGIAALLIAILTWYGSVQARSQQLTDLSNQVGGLSNEITLQQQQTSTELRHLQNEIDNYLLQRSGMQQ